MIQCRKNLPRRQEETESNLFPMGQKHLLFLPLTKHISVCLAAISTPALISADQLLHHLCKLNSWNERTLDFSLTEKWTIVSKKQTQWKLKV